MTIIGDEEENLTEDAMTGEAAERLFSEEAMVAATLRARAMENTLGLFGYKAPGKGSAPLDQIALLLGEDLIDEPGEPTRDALDQVLELFRAKLLAPPSS